MTDRIALGIGIVIVAAIGADLWSGTGGTLFLLRKLAALTEYLAFWR